MRTTNEVHLIGHAGKDAVASYTKSGKMMVKFSLATGGGKKRDGGNYDVDWHNCTSWGEELGAVAGLIEKGQVVEVFGRISYSTSEKDGVKRYYTDIVCQRINLDGGDEHDQRAPAERARPVAAPSSQEITDEDVPF